MSNFFFFLGWAMNQDSKKPTSSNAESCGKQCHKHKGLEEIERQLPSFLARGHQKPAFQEDHWWRLFPQSADQQHSYRQQGPWRSRKGFHIWQSDTDRALEPQRCAPRSSTHLLHWKTRLLQTRIQRAHPPASSHQSSRQEWHLLPPWSTRKTQPTTQILAGCASREFKLWRSQGSGVGSCSHSLSKIQLLRVLLLVSRYQCSLSLQNLSEAT